jgi:hypothetical protein
MRAWPPPRRPGVLEGSGSALPVELVTERSIPVPATRGQAGETLDGVPGPTTGPPPIFCVHVAQ